MSDLRAPFPYFGGKSRAASLAWERFGRCVNYVEPFFGSGAVLLACPEAQRPRVETVNDANAFLANFWRATAVDPEAVARAADWPVNECDLHSRHSDLLRRGPALRALLDDPKAFDAEAAGWWVWGASAWIGSGWCEEGRRASEQLPSVSANGSHGPCAVHAAGMREPSQRLPDFGNGTVWGTTDPQPRSGKGIHGLTMREPSRQLPSLSANGSHGPCGVHAAGAREPSRQLPHLSANANGRGENHPGEGRGIDAGTTRTRLYDIFAALAERLRYTRVACGDWARICTPAVTYRHGLTAAFLDCPYPGYEQVYGSEPVWPAVKAWALENGTRTDMRIAVCGYEGTAPELEAAGWERVAWKAKGGYSNQGTGNENSKRERLWFSPHCLRPGVNVGQIGLPGVAT